MKKYMVLLAILISAGMNVTAQNVVSGKVYDNNTKEPLAGVTIFAPQTSEGTITKKNGSFNFVTKEKIDSVHVSFVGYKTRIISVRENKTLSISLEENAENLQGISITASRDRQERKDVPASISRLNPKMIQETAPTQLNQILNKIPGLVMKDLNNEQHMMGVRQPMTKQPYFLYLEDGLPIAPVGNFNHNQLIEVNMLGLNSVEVVKGPSSSIYGSNAIGGAINFITQSPSSVPVARVGVQQNNYGYKRIEFYSGSYLTKDFGLSIGGYMANQRDGWQEYSDFDKYSLSAKAVYHIDKRNQIKAYITSNDLEAQTGSSIDSAGFYSGKYLANNNFSYRKVNSLRAYVQYETEWNENNNTSVSVYSQSNSIAQNPRYRFKNIDKYTASGEENNNVYTNYGFVAQHSYKFDFLNSKLLFGLAGNIAPTDYNAYHGEILRDSVTGYYESFIKTDSLLADYQTKLFNLGSYLQYEFNPTRDLKIVAGIRYDNLTYDYSNSLHSNAYSGVPDTSLTYFTLSPKIGATYSLSKKSGLYANYSKGFTPPQVSDLFFGSKVPALKPAYFTNYEIGAWTALLKEKLFADIALYNMIGDGEIISFRLPDNSTENRNSGKTLHQGIEYSLTYKPINDLLFRFGGTNAIHKYIDFKVQETSSGEMISYDGNYMPEAPKMIVNSEITYKPHFAKGLRTAIEWQYISPWFKDEQNTRIYDDKTLALKGVSLLNLRVGYKFQGFEFYCNVLNLTNELYANGVTYAYGNDTYAVGAPRVFTFGFIYDFSNRE